LYGGLLFRYSAVTEGLAVILPGPFIGQLQVPESRP
jgi:hypothetical protein